MNQLTEELLPHLSILLLPHSYRCLGKSIPRYFIGDIRSAQSSTRDLQAFCNDIREELDIPAFHFYTLLCQLRVSSSELRPRTDFG